MKFGDSCSLSWLQKQGWSLALLQAYLSQSSFTKDKGTTVLEQLLGLERLVEEYAKVAKEEISDNTKLSVLLRVMQERRSLPMSDYSTGITRHLQRACNHQGL